ncbi:heterokaryon incompatibility protein-domain-containing protein [Daedaleopsis nitida]|nr:heterokaryon incompatibility protein-domain-containing protein [Daedaleopsis nitida]
MWLLNSRTLQLKFFVSPEKVYGGYAILSHCWDDDEQSFKDLRKIHKRCSASGTDPRDHVCEKIRRCCELVRLHGHVWVWIDTCCIDNTSSAELSEAISSMYRYYAMAKVCYAYLRDVPTEGAFTFERGRYISPFARSRWHRRGWTLQELIAPRFVLLLSSSWDVLGSKADLAEDLESITGIPATVLRLEERAQARSVAQRMSWASRRETTREEDEAYCLLGLFGIHIPTLYGEGRQAFRRLQEEIMRTSPDTTLFAWGPISTMTEGDKEDGQDADRASGLFAVRPSDFCHSKDIEYTPQTRISAGVSRLSAPLIYREY